MRDLAREQLDETQLNYLGLLMDAGCKLIFRTWLFGKSYVWMKDNAGTIFLERLPESITAVSVDGQTGEVTPVR